MRQGYTYKVHWGNIQHSPPTSLKMSPVACIPHKSKANCVILDLSFSTNICGTALPSVNDATNKQAKEEAMFQLCSTLKQIVATMADAGPELFAFAKLDVQD
eukprot:12368769-Ditylum_brightwellii.AAC.1